MNTDTIDLDLELSDSALETLDVSSSVEVPVVDTVVLDEDLVVSPVETTEAPVPSASTPAPKTGRGRGRVPSADVAARRENAARVVTEVLRSATEPLTVSEIHRLCQARGLDGKNSWLDVYSFIHHSEHEFVQAKTKGSRAKWTVQTPSA